MIDEEIDEVEQRELEKLAGLEDGEWDVENHEVKSLAEKRRKRKRAILERFGQDNVEDNHANHTEVKQTVESTPALVKHQVEHIDEHSEDSKVAAAAADDDDGSDMFASESPVETVKTEKAAMVFTDSAIGDDVEDTANYDDAEGYYKATIGEIISVPTSVGKENPESNEIIQYRVLGNIGKGVFSSVVKCCRVDEPQTIVALKLIRNNETMAKAAQRELRILKVLASSKGPGNAHCVRLLSGSGYEHRNHITFYFESMHLNLRETLHKFGKGVGIQLMAVRQYTRQLLLALEHLKSLSIVHADIKPDNILVNSDFSCVKLCDFGSAFFVTDVDAKDPTPYLVSRFYRPPEVILGMEYSHPVDLWSIAVTIAELFRGIVLFPGNTNNDMLHLFMESLGPFSNKMLKRHFLAFERLGLSPHFEKDFTFRRQDVDFVTGRPVLRMTTVTSAQSNKTLSYMFTKSKSQSDDRGDVMKFSDLLVRCLALDPARRISISDALRHDFLKRTPK